MDDGPQHAAPPAPVERKVHAAATGAGAGVVLAQLVCWVLDNYALTPGVTGDLPSEVSVAVPLAVAYATAWIAGYKARHTPRPDLAARRPRTNEGEWQ
ncbi:holin [Micromonospora maritima]|uniref:holin n=1 Tax=Micromonospora maritima TaxID=986711 RepID=UPI00157CDB41|nr:holin [Micromonospora maritima]